MSKYKCIIFDCDGVLVDSESLSNQVMIDLANAAGANIDMEYAYTHFKGNSLQNCIDQITESIGRDIPFDFESEFRRLTFEKFKNEIQPIEGVMQVLDSLEIPFCVASSGPENKIKLNLELTGILPYFKGKIFSCYTIGKWKPDPAVFLWAAKTMGYVPEECLVIEDSPIGVKAAIDGGFDVFGFTAHDYKEELKENATQVFDKMITLKDLL